MLQHGTTNYHLMEIFSFEALVEKTVLKRQIFKKGACAMTYMQNLAAETIERKRHDVAQEAQQQAELAETQRSHKVQEALSTADLAEKIRHQTTMDAEEMRSHRVNEEIIREHNRATEEIAREANAISKYSADLKYSTDWAKMVNDKQIAQLKADSDQLIAAAKNKVDMINAESNKKQAEASLKSASAKMNESFAKLDQAAAAIMNAQVNKQLAPANAVQLYTKSVGNIAGAALDVERTLTGQGMLPSGPQAGQTPTASSKELEEERKLKKYTQIPGKYDNPDPRRLQPTFGYNPSTFAPKRNHN
jgi:E3 ubiquitin-protein ligase DOA10